MGNEDTTVYLVYLDGLYLFRAIEQLQGMRKNAEVSLHLMVVGIVCANKVEGCIHVSLFVTCNLSSCFEIEYQIKNLKQSDTSAQLQLS